MRFFVIALQLSATGCAPTLSETAPIAIFLPDGAVLKGGISLRLGKGYFQASNGRLTCSGEATRSAGGLSVGGPCAGSNASVKRIAGSATEIRRGSGEGMVSLDTRGTARLLYGDDVRAIKER